MVGYASSREYEDNGDYTVRFTENPSENYAPHYGFVEINIPVPRSNESEAGLWRSFLTFLESAGVIRENKDYFKYTTMKINKPILPDDFFKNIENGDEGILLFIHGFNVTFDEAVSSIARLKVQAQLPGIPVAYSWAAGSGVVRSGTYSPYSGYGHDVQIATNSCGEFQKFLQRLSNQFKKKKIYVIAHSHGANILHSSISSCQINNYGVSLGEKFSQVVLASPDIDKSQFVQSSKKMSDSASRVTIYVSANDTAILAAGGLERNLPRLGMGGPTRTVVDGIETIDASDVSTSLGDQYGHSYLFLSSKIHKDLLQLLRYNETTENRCLEERQQQPGNSIYFVFKKTC